MPLQIIGSCGISYIVIIAFIRLQDNSSITLDLQQGVIEVCIIFCCYYHNAVVFNQVSLGVNTLVFCNLTELSCGWYIALSC